MNEKEFLEKYYASQMLRNKLAPVILAIKNLKQIMIQNDGVLNADFIIEPTKVSVLEKFEQLETRFKEISDEIDKLDET